MAGIYDITVKDRLGNDVSLKDYAGKVLLIVNTATGCGFTPQYTDLQALYEKYHEQGFEILDFPCDQFGHQAPGSDDEIHEFCTSNYQTTFPRFAKIEVNGEGASPLFKYLKDEMGFGGFDLDDKIGKLLDDMLSQANPNYAESSDIMWNFTKFLIDQEGQVVTRYEPTTAADVIEEEIKKQLA